MTNQIRQEIYTGFEHQIITNFSWTDKDLTYLEKLNQQYKKQVLIAITYRGKRVIKATEFVGIFPLGNHTIQVLPKLCQGLDIQRATTNLLFLLDYSGLALKQFKDYHYLLAGNLSWLEILTRLFVTSLQEQWQRGAYYSYQSKDDVLSVLKGKWQLEKQIYKPNIKHKFCVAYDDFTVNNEINQVLKYCIEKLYITSNDAYNLKVIQLLRCLMTEVTLPKIITIQDIDKIKINRLNQRYEHLLEIAKLFLNQQGLLFSTGQIKTSAFIINMNQLFEKFITNFIENHHSEILSPRLQNYHIISQARGISKHLAYSDNNQSSFLLKPDLVVKSGEHFPVLLDTKYKILTSSDRILSSDFYQMYAYANRYNCPLVIIIYPQIGDTSAKNKEFRLQGSDKIIRVGTVDLRGDLHQSQEQQKLIKRLKELLRG